MELEDKKRKEDNPWLTRATDLQNGVLVGASLMAGLAFQSFVSPPGGFWQDDLHDVPANDPLRRKNHTAGDPIWRDKDPSAYRGFRVVNWIAFALSGLAILGTLFSMEQSKRGRQLLCAFVAYYVAFVLLLVNLLVFSM